MAGKQKTAPEVSEKVAATVEVRPLDGLIAYARNARTHDDEQVAQIMSSIMEWGWTNPVLADESGIVAGHGRCMAARKLYEQGKTIRLPNGKELPAGTVPVIDVSGWSEAKRRAYILADNKLALNAGWDFDMLALELDELRGLDFDLRLVGFDTQELNDLLEPTNDRLDAEKYTDKITVPTYEPSELKPAVNELFDESKAMSLIAAIRESSIQENEKAFLIAAASRHIVFDYSKIADFYSHASAECQGLMEQSALVIIDFDKAIENGFVQLTKQMDSLHSSDGDYEDEE